MVQNPLLQKTQQYMRWLGERQKIIAQNLSHVDTPSYRTQDLVPFDQTLKTTTIQPALTQKGHMPPRVSQEFALKPHKGHDTKISGNNVSIEEELMKTSEVSHAHALMANQYKKTMGLFRLAIGHRGGNH